MKIQKTEYKEDKKKLIRNSPQKCPKSKKEQTEKFQENKKNPKIEEKREKKSSER